MTVAFFGAQITPFLLALLSGTLALLAGAIFVWTAQRVFSGRRPVRVRVSQRAVGSRHHPERMFRPGDLPLRPAPPRAPPTYQRHDASVNPRDTFLE